ncbi:MAG: FMN-binding protein [Deltaproteobacteria bacterium]|jgi:Na+-translocating ferredoxin:NAD+ oxidoreductase RnfG subunit|nr:FMN-binding protein [Deltaproteobacteria bacterium]
MGFTWYCLGLLTTGSTIFLWHFSKRYQINGLAWSGLTLGIVLILFSIAWAVGSVLEGVPRAASMGLLLFGMSGIVLLTLALRYTLTKRPKMILAGAETTPHQDIEIDTAHQKTESVKASIVGPYVSVALRYGAYSSLVIALVIGLTTEGKDYEGMVRNKFKDQKLTKVNDDPVVFQMGVKGDGPGNWVLIQEGQGYGGPFVLGIRIMEDGKIHEIIPLDHKETPAFVKKIEDARYRDQFIRKSVGHDFIVGVDINAVSGATVTTMAAAQAIRNGAHLAAVEKFKLDPKWAKVRWKLGLDEILILVIFVLAFVPKIYKEKPWKYIYLTATIAVVGFYLNAAISVGNIAGLALGYIPGIKDHLIWWILVVGTVLSVIFLGKNIYCYRICPFYGIEYLLQKISGMKLNPSRALLKRARFVVNLLLWLSLMVIFLSEHPALGSYEPFAMMFSLNGVGIQWFILPLALIGSFFMSAFWCRFFCPCGHVLTKLVQFRKKLIKTIKRK